MAELLTRQDIASIDAETTVIFDHIYKCAGTSVFQWFLDTVGQDGVLGVYMKDDLFGMKDWKDRRPRVVGGHFVRGAHHALADRGRAAYCTMLRDPLRAAISGYGYAKRQFAVAAELDIDTYLLDYRPNPFVNHLGQDSFAKARETLLETYCAFGLVEHFDLSLWHFARNLLHLGQCIRPSGRLNASARHAAETIHPDVLAHFRNMNAEDQALYDLAADEFRRRVAADPPPAFVSVEAAVEGQAGDTRDFSDIHEALARHDYRGAIALFVNEHLDDLPHWHMTPACGLAISLGDFDAAERLFQRLRAQCPYFCLREYVDYLLIREDAARAVEVVEDECAQYAFWPDPPADSELFLFQAETLCLLLRVRHKASGALDEALLARIAAMGRVSGQALSALAETLLAVRAYDRVVELAGSSKGLQVGDAAWRDMLRFEARACYHLGRLSEAAGICRQALERDACDHEAILLGILLDRKLGGGAADCDRFEALALRFPGSLYASEILKELAVRHYEGGRRDRAFELVASIRPGGRDRLLDDPQPGCRSVPFGEVDLGEFVLIKAGPQMVFDYLAREFPGLRERPFDLVGGLSASAPDTLRAVSPFPRVRYEHERDRAEVVSGLSRDAYDTALVVMSGYCPREYAEILKLARSLSAGAVYCYTFDHLMSGRHRRNVMLHP